ncbi:hypothetical protein [Afifella sp. IM 167]|uniref:hypothetical protein n=1 Tax=Afifella sp. IM 167 TaxID=2033586 RepID=UPI001CCA32D4|nr:hypothetical protein [Afifella sp. IM 167]MBZ8135112.1 hypothetical protein [Afifella sp. IM 167]
MQNASPDKDALRKARVARLAEALRANLKRRKARARSADGEGPGGEDGPEDAGAATKGPASASIGSKE